MGDVFCSYNCRSCSSLANHRGGLQTSVVHLECFVKRVYCESVNGFFPCNFGRCYILIFLLGNTDLVTRKLLKETHKNKESRRVCPSGKVWGQEVKQLQCFAKCKPPLSFFSVPLARFLSSVATKALSTQPCHRAVSKL